MLQKKRERKRERSEHVSIGHLQEVKHAFHTKKLLIIKSELVWYFIVAYIINRTLHGCLEIRNFLPCVLRKMSSFV